MKFIFLYLINLMYELYKNVKYGLTANKLIHTIITFN